MKTGTDLAIRGQEKVLLFGKPKGGGKSTLAMTAPGNKLVMQYDLGDITLPPGVDPGTAWVQDYPNISPEITGDTERWVRSTVTGKKIIEDLNAIKESFVTGTGILTLPDGATCPLPETLILDGLVALNDHMISWIMGMNRVTTADDMPGGGFSLWNKRLFTMSTIFNLVLSLPCRVILITWETQEKVTVKGVGGKALQEPTGRMIPDVGGKLDDWTPGKVDASLRCYSQKTTEGTKFFVQTQSDGIYPALGIRNGYGIDPVIDVTIQKGKPLPWSRIWK